jgi:hypothetical protein
VRAPLQTLYADASELQSDKGASWPYDACCGCTASHAPVGQAQNDTDTFEHKGGLPHKSGKTAHWQVCSSGLRDTLNQMHQQANTHYPVRGVSLLAAAAGVLRHIHHMLGSQGGGATSQTSLHGSTCVCACAPCTAQAL